MMENFFDENRERMYDPLYRLFNYVTGQYEDLTDMPDDLLHYIPQHRDAQLMYFYLIELGETPLHAKAKAIEAYLKAIEASLKAKEAYLKVMEALVGKEALR